MNGNDWYTDGATRSWLAVARQLAEWNAGERPAALRGYACVSPRAAARGLRATVCAVAQIPGEATSPGNVKQSVNVL